MTDKASSPAASVMVPAVPYDRIVCPMSGCGWQSASRFIDVRPVHRRDLASLRLLDAEALSEHLQEDHDAYDPREPANA